MCTYSMIYRDWTHPESPNQIPWTPKTPDPDTAKQMLEILRRIDELDKKLDKKNCEAEEAEKKAFEKKLKRRAARKKK